MTTRRLTTDGGVRSPDRVEHGDWQTPPALAGEVVAALRRAGVEADVIIEPTCGSAAFLKAAAAAYPSARLLGFELSPAHLAAASVTLAGTDAELHLADFFRTDWAAVLRGAAGQILILGNPPWVTSSTLGALSSDNLPQKFNFKRHRGIDARTGKGNFDISESMIVGLLTAAEGRAFTLAMLCKSSVARRVLEAASERSWALDGSMYRIDARAHFDAAVDAVLLVLKGPAAPREAHRWSVYARLDASLPACHMGVVDGAVCSDVDAALRTRDLAGGSEVEWRSGVKHDCADIMELRRRGDALVNGLGDVVDIEPDHVYPLWKGSDVAHGRASSGRFVLVTQRVLGDDTAVIRERAPRTWAYLVRHRERLEARKSSIYRGQPGFAMFGVGPYAFAPFKVAICGLYKRLSFCVVEAVDGRPAMLDDTSYFLPCVDRARAERVARALNGRRAREFFEGRVFWEAKRPIHKSLLQSMSLEALLATE